MKITLRQLEVLNHLKECGVSGSDSEGSVLRSLESKGLVLRHHNSAPGHTFFTWTVTDLAKSETFTIR